MPDAHKNFPYSLVATAPSPAISGTSLIVTAGQGALFPAVPFNATIWPVGVLPISTNAEIVRVTEISTDTLTITRAQESSSARTVIVGDQIAATITAKTLTDIEPLNLNAPQGFLLNGRISVTVATNDITVAIKTMAGADATATDPIYCRIGNTVRTISGALSVTRNDGTNWFNSGSVELGTREIDYFVYLGYNATDGVVVGFSRIPSANQYSDFSASTTNEKHCAISTITTAASTDFYELIGRFAATLSLTGTGFLWTVPTFTAINLIQHPIYETRWLIWLPTYSGSGALTYTSVTGVRVVYKIRLDTVLIEMRMTGTTGGTTNNAINITVPFGRFDTSSQLTIGVAWIFDGADVSGYIQFNSTSQVQLGMRKYNNVNIALSANTQISSAAFYSI